MLTGGPSGLGSTLVSTGGALQESGLAGTPVVGPTVGGVVAAGDKTLNGVGKVVVLDQPLLGSSAADSNQLVSVSAAAKSQPQGSLLTAGVASTGQPLAAPNLAKVTLGERTALGGQGPALIGASVLSPAQASGTAATVGVASGTSGGLGGVLGGVAPVNAVANVAGGGTTTVGGLTGALGLGVDASAQAGGKPRLLGLGRK